MNSLPADITLSVIRFLETLHRAGELEPYLFVQNLSEDLRDSLGGAIYAYNANRDALTSEQEKRVIALDELTGLSQEMGEYDCNSGG